MSAFFIWCNAYVCTFQDDTSDFSCLRHQTFAFNAQLLHPLPWGRGSPHELTVLHFWCTAHRGNKLGSPRENLLHSKCNLCQQYERIHLDGEALFSVMVERAGWWCFWSQTVEAKMSHCLTSYILLVNWWPKKKKTGLAICILADLSIIHAATILLYDHLSKGHTKCPVVVFTNPMSCTQWGERDNFIK